MVEVPYFMLEEYDFQSLLYHYRRNKESLFQVDSDGDNLIHYAALFGNLDFIKAVISEIPELKSTSEKLSDMIRQTNKRGQNTIHRAISSGHVEVAKFLADNYKFDDKNRDSKLLLYQQDEDGNTLFHLCLKEEQEDLACFLLSKVRHLPKSDIDDYTSAAAESGRFGDQINKDGESPMYIAVRGGYKQFIKEYFEVFSGQTIDGNGPFGHTALHIASKLPGDIVRLLIDHIRDLNKRDNEARTALHNYAESGATHLVRLVLLKDTSSADVKDKNGLTPLLLACSLGHIEILRTIVELSPTSVKFHDGSIMSTVLHYAKFPRAELYRQLLEIPTIKKLVNQRDGYLMTPLHKAILDNEFVKAKVLLTTGGVNLKIKDEHRRTALDLIKEQAAVDKEWEVICYQHGIFQTRTAYVPPSKNLKDVGSTMSVVAALLATITFAAGFTIPGGVDSKSGEALLGKIKGIFYRIHDIGRLCNVLLSCGSILANVGISFELRRVTFPGRS